LVAMVPNVVPVLVFFGSLGLGAAPLSLPTSLIGAIALGIAIDATAHYVIRYRSERVAGCDPAQAVARTTARVGRPIAIAAVMLIVGFLSVALSDFATLRQFGVLTAFTMAVCALTDLTLLPAILVRLRL
ncbi:MAG: MMPL family transporter, partial [Myxococcota bacterium]